MRREFLKWAGFFGGAAGVPKAGPELRAKYAASKFASPPEQAQALALKQFDEQWARVQQVALGAVESSVEELIAERKSPLANCTPIGQNLSIRTAVVIPALAHFGVKVFLDPFTPERRSRSIVSSMVRRPAGCSRWRG